MLREGFVKNENKRFASGWNGLNMVRQKVTLGSAVGAYSYHLTRHAGHAISCEVAVSKIFLATLTKNKSYAYA